MGEVYLAEDIRLHRKVALKVLRVELSNLKERIHRFENEARAISAINHPNILTIYDIGQINSSSFIASEYIEGKTLRDRIRTSKIPLTEVLEIALQVAEALHAAHRAGIVHRDVKPENVMLRADGYVKVLDFGIAKLVQRNPDLDPSHLETIGQDTETGVVVGTYKYMSPEQARGLKVDARSDVFSFAVLFQEMLVGRSPFEGATTNDVLVAILEKHPPPLSAYGKFPEELQWILIKALAKDREKRYQSMKDLLIDLKRVKHQLDAEEENRHAGVSREAMETQAAPVQKTRKAPFLLTSAVVVLVALAISSFLILQNREEVPETKTPFAEPKLTRLTSSGKAWGGILSPDGKYVAYVQEGPSGQQSIHLRQLSTDTDIPIVTSAEKTFFYGGRRFSPDGEYLYFVLYPGQDKASLYQVPILGGVTKRIINDIDHGPAFSPDGKKMAFVRNTNSESHLMIAQADGSNQQTVRRQKLPVSYHDVEWSPNESFITAIKGHLEKGIVQVHVENNSERSLLDLKWATEYFTDLQWTQDGKGFIVTMPRDGTVQIFYVAYPGGKLTPITSDLNNYMGVKLANDSQSFVTTMQRFHASLWSSHSAKPDAAVQITSGVEIDDGHVGLCWMPDGKIVYSSPDPDGVYQLWSIHPDGTNRKRITSGKQHRYWPAASPDGKYILFNSEQLGKNFQIWRIDADGGNAKLLSGKKEARWPRISPDGEWILYSTLGEEQELIKLSWDGTAETVLATHKVIYGGAISPNGKQVGYLYSDVENSKNMINILAVEGSEKLKSFPISDFHFAGGRVHWSPDRSSLAFLLHDNGVFNIFLQPVDGSQRQRLTNSKEDIFNFTWSSDGKQIAFSRGALRSDIVLIRNSPQQAKP